MPSKRQLFVSLLAAVSLWGSFDGSAMADGSRSLRVGPAPGGEDDKPLNGEVSRENEDAPPELKQIQVYISNGTVVMHAQGQELTITETTPLGIKGKTDFSVNGSVRFEYPGKKAWVGVDGIDAHAVFDNGPTVRVSGARSADARDGASMAASSCKSVSARDGSSLTATDCTSVMVRDGSTGKVSNCQSVEFREDARGSAANCKTVSIRGSDVKLENCSTLAVRDKSKVSCDRCAKVEARDDSEVTVSGVSSIQARDTARVFYSGSPEISTWGSPVVRRR